jgi:hypothetical protein
MQTTGLPTLGSDIDFCYVLASLLRVVFLVLPWLHACDFAVWLVIIRPEGEFSDPDRDCTCMGSINCCSYQIFSERNFLSFPFVLMYAVVLRWVGGGGHGHTAPPPAQSMTKKNLLVSTYNFYFYLLSSNIRPQFLLLVEEYYKNCCHIYLLYLLLQCHSHFSTSQTFLTLTIYIYIYININSSSI